MFMAAKPATATRRSRILLPRQLRLGLDRMHSGAAGKPARPSAVDQFDLARTQWIVGDAHTLGREVSPRAHHARNGQRGAFDRAQAAAAAHVLDGEREDVQSRIARLDLSLARDKCGGAGMDGHGAAGTTRRCLSR